MVSPSPEEVRCRVLVVDDNEDFADLMAILISRWGHEARAAYSGTQCIEVAQAFKPQLILLDIGLPGLDGFEVAKKLTGTSLPQPIIAAISGYVDESHVARCQEAGFAHCFGKPVDNSEMREFIASVCRHTTETQKLVST